MNDEHKKTLSEICHKIQNEHNIPTIYDRGETIRIRVSYPDDENAHPHIEIIDQPGKTIIENRPMDIIAEGSGEFGNMSIAQYDMITNDTLLGEYNSIVTVSGGKYYDCFVVVK